MAQGSLCPGRLCLLPRKDARDAGGLKCRKNAVKMKRTVKMQVKLPLDSALDEKGRSW